MVKRWIVRGIIGSLMAATVVAGAGPGMASAAPVPCAHVILTATPAPPTTVALGTPVTVLTSLSDCSGAAEVVKVKVGVTGPSGTFAFPAFPIRLRAGRTLSGSVSFLAPLILGTYSATVTVSSGLTVLDTASASFIVA